MISCILLAGQLWIVTEQGNTHHYAALDEVELIKVDHNNITVVATKGGFRSVVPSGFTVDDLLSSCPDRGGSGG